MCEVNIPQSDELSQAVGAAGCLPAEDYLWQNYRLRHNVLSGKVEYRVINEDDSRFRPLTEQDLNSIILCSRRDGYTGKDDISADLKLLVNSIDIVKYDPIGEYLSGLKWDGKERIVDFWRRIPGITAEDIYFLTIWFRGLVAQWLHINKEHGNEVIPTLIGKQGIGKTTFFLRMLPPQFRSDYFLPRFHLANKFDADMAITNNLIVNLDEFDQYTASQHAKIKQYVSVTTVNGRKIFGKAQENRPRYASFTATTNDAHPLTDPTGARRNICIVVPDGGFIDNTTDIEHDQLFAQVKYELEEKHERYWFTNEETARLMQKNAPFLQVNDVDKMIEMCVCPAETPSSYITTSDIINKVKEFFPEVDKSHLSSIKVGRVMKQLGYNKKHLTHHEVYIASLRNIA